MTIYDSKSELRREIDALRRALQYSRDLNARMVKLNVELQNDINNLRQTYGLPTRPIEQGWLNDWENQHASA